MTDAYGLWLHNPAGTVMLIGAIGVPGVVDGVFDGFSGGTIPIGQWTHVAMTYDSETGDNKLYVNGDIVVERIRTGGITQSDLTVRIGAEDSFLPRRFQGLVDEVGIYNRALSQSEIRAIFTAGSAGKCRD
jgi:Concanavalin A-like lectin/glucanases superfamily